MIEIGYGPTSAYDAQYQRGFVGTSATQCGTLNVRRAEDIDGLYEDGCYGEYGGSNSIIAANAIDDLHLRAMTVWDSSNSGSWSRRCRESPWSKRKPSA